MRVSGVVFATFSPPILKLRAPGAVDAHVPSVMHAVGVVVLVDALRRGLRHLAGAVREASISSRKQA